jgi:hypothetical protein
MSKREGTRSVYVGFLSIFGITGLSRATQCFPAIPPPPASAFELSLARLLRLALCFFPLPHHALDVCLMGTVLVTNGTHRKRAVRTIILYSEYLAEGGPKQKGRTIEWSHGLAAVRHMGQLSGMLGGTQHSRHTRGAVHRHAMAMLASASRQMQHVGNGAFFALASPSHSLPARSVSS